LIEFKVSDIVLLSIKNLRLLVAKKKLSARFIRPFCMRDAISKQAYRLALPTTYCIHDVFYVLLLKLYKQRIGKEPAEPILLADDEGK